MKRYFLGTVVFMQNVGEIWDQIRKYQREAEAGDFSRMTEISKERYEAELKRNRHYVCVVNEDGVKHY